MKKILLSLLSLIPCISNATENSSLSLAAARDYYWGLREEIVKSDRFYSAKNPSDFKIIRAISADEFLNFGGSFDRIEPIVDAGRKGFVCYKALDDSVVAHDDVKNFHASLFESLQSGWVPVTPDLREFADKPELLIKNDPAIYDLFLKRKMAIRPGLVGAQRTILEELSFKNGLTQAIDCSDRVITRDGHQNACGIIYLWVAKNALDTVEKTLGLQLKPNTHQVEPTVGYLQSFVYTAPKSAEWSDIENALKIIKRRMDK